MRTTIKEPLSVRSLNTVTSITIAGTPADVNRQLDAGRNPSALGSLPGTGGRLSISLHPSEFGGDATCVALHWLASADVCGPTMRRPGVATAVLMPQGAGVRLVAHGGLPYGGREANWPPTIAESTWIGLATDMSSPTHHKPRKVVVNVRS